MENPSQTVDITKKIKSDYVNNKYFKIILHKTNSKLEFYADKEHLKL